jgi:hypothetical protein
MIIFKPSEQKRELDYLVTGVSRSGTVYMAKLLTSLGFPCTHEAVFTPYGYRSVSKTNSAVSTHDGPWLNKEDKIVAESSYMGAPHVKALKCLRDTKVIHIIREPLRVVFSILDGFNYFQHPHPDNDPYQTFIYVHVPDLTQDLDPVSRACLFYVEWNEMIEKQEPDFVYHVESEVEPLAEFLNVKADDYFKNRRANSRSNGFNHTHDEIPEGSIKDRFIEMSNRYGYTIISA